MNLQNLIQISCGCGEQNLLKFVPSLVALKYLEATNQLDSVLRAKAIRYAEIGYQRQLFYLHYDGSFSAFGKEVNKIGSTWLTAFSVSAFTLASEYITIDSNVINRAFTFFVSKQEANGTFREDGKVINKRMQGGASKGFPMTAIISIVLSQNIAQFPKYTNARNLALDYIAASVNTSDIYELCISTLALHLGNHPSFSRVLTYCTGKKTIHIITSHPSLLK